MIQHSIILKEKNKMIALSHSELGEYIGIAYATIESDTKTIKIDELVTRYDSEMMLLRAIGGYAQDNQLRVRANPDKTIKKMRERENVRRWDAMSQLDEYNPLELNELTSRSDLSPGLRHSFLIPCDERTKRHTRSYREDSVPEVVSLALSKGKEVLDAIAESPVVVYIEDDFPIPPADPVTGKNVLTGYQLKDVVDVYTSGCCMFLALALQERFGFDIDMHISKYQGNWMIEHAWCSINGIGVDVNGIQDKYEWIGTGSFKRNVTKKQIFTLMNGSDEYPDFTEDKGDQAISDAHQLIDNYLLDYHPEITDLAGTVELGVTRRKTKDYDFSL